MSKRLKFDQESKESKPSPILKLSRQLLLSIYEYTSVFDLIGLYWCHRDFQSTVQTYWTTSHAYLPARLRHAICRYMGIPEEKRAEFWAAVERDKAYWMDTGLLGLILNEHVVVSNDPDYDHWIYLHFQQNINYSTNFNVYERIAYEISTRSTCHDLLWNLYFLNNFTTSKLSAYRIREQDSDMRKKDVCNHVEWYGGSGIQTKYTKCRVDDLCAFPSISRQVLTQKNVNEPMFQINFHGMDPNIYDLKRLRSTGLQYDVLNLSFDGKQLHMGNVASFYLRQAHMQHDIHSELQSQRRDFIRRSFFTIGKWLKQHNFNVIYSQEYLDIRESMLQLI